MLQLMHTAARSKLDGVSALLQRKLDGVSTMSAINKSQGWDAELYPRTFTFTRTPLTSQTFSRAKTPALRVLSPEASSKRCALTRPSLG